MYILCVVVVDVVALIRDLLEEYVRVLLFKHDYVHITTHTYTCTDM